jgi:hypothetical protein
MASSLGCKVSGGKLAILIKNMTMGSGKLAIGRRKTWRGVKVYALKYREPF